MDDLTDHSAELEDSDIRGGDRVQFTNIIRPLANYEALCYANSFFQIYFHIKYFQDFINTLPPTNPLRKFASVYFDGHQNTIEHTVNFYRNFPFWREIYKSKDLHLFLIAFNRYYSGVNSFMSLRQIIDDQIEYTMFFQIEQRNNIQEGLNHYLSQQNYDSFPKILTIGIDRTTLNERGERKLSRLPININKYLTIEEDITHFYKITGLILHTGRDPNGHFQAVLFNEEKITFCNDTSIREKIPKGLNEKAIKLHACLLVYEEIDRIDDIDINSFIELKSEIHQQQDSHHDFGSPSQVVSIVTDEERQNRITIPDEPDEIENISISTNYRSCQPDKTVKTNLHNIFNDIHGFIDADFTGSPINDFGPNEAVYQKRANCLAIITRILGRLPFNYRVTQGDVNLSMVTHQLNIQAIIPSDEQVIECAVIVKQIFNRWKESEEIEEKEIEKEIKAALNEVIQSIPPTGPTFSVSQSMQDSEDDNEQIDYSSSDISDLNGNNEDEIFTGLLSEHYKWRERKENFGAEIISAILDEVNKQNNDISTNDQSLRNDLRTTLIESYLENGHNHTSISKFIDDFMKTRASFCGANRLEYSKRQYLAIIQDWMKDGQITTVKKRGGSHGKVTRETLECLITTVLDFPDATDSERAVYLNQYGPNINDNISESTVNRILNKLNITVQTPCFSVKERNNMGYRIARVLWAEEMQQLHNDPNTMIAFVDEASVVLGRRNKCRGFSSIRPCVTKNHRTKSLSILACIIPNFGSIYKWYKKGVRAVDYARFLREASHIIRTKLCNEGTNIVFVNDNASIHKSDIVKETCEKCKINLIFSVPYSPQCNLPAENFFAQLKFNALNAFKSVPNERPQQFPIQHNLPLISTLIIKQWDEKVASRYDATTSANIYSSWVTILNYCKRGMPLNGLHVPQSANIIPQMVHGLINCRREAYQESSSGSQ